VERALAEKDDTEAVREGLALKLQVWDRSKTGKNTLLGSTLLLVRPILEAGPDAQDALKLFTTDMRLAGKRVLGSKGQPLQLVVSAEVVQRSHMSHINMGITEVCESSVLGSPSALVLMQAKVKQLKQLCFT
jgi:hypothetical protein